MVFYKKGRIPFLPINKTDSEEIHSWIRANTIDILGFVRDGNSIYTLD